MRKWFIVRLYATACVKFSPALSDLTRTHADEMVTVLVSGDRDAESAALASRGRGFLRVPFASPHRGRLMRAFTVYAIPVLVAGPLAPYTSTSLPLFQLLLYNLS